MDFDSPDVEKDFPGLYASETGGKSKKDDKDCKLQIMALGFGAKNILNLFAHFVHIPQSLKRRQKK